MKRLILGLLVFIALTFTSLLGGSAEASVNDFYISSYDIIYDLSKDDAGHSTLKTVENIKAQFDNPNQNRGIERAIPRSYDGHKTNLQIESVVDQDNNSLEFTTYDSNDNLVVRIGNPNVYVEGEKTYIITYTQKDVTRFFADTNADEFYWDTNGVDWKVPIDRINILLRVDKKIAGDLNGNKACYIGGQGSRQTCDLSESGDGIFSAYASFMSPGDNISIATGFQANTFAAYKPSLAETLMGIWLILTIVSIPVAVALIIWFSWRYSRWSSRSNELGTIVAEYLPPKETSVTTAANVLSGANSIFAAQLIDFAVRHYIKIYETKPKSFFRSAEFDIEIVKDTSSLLPEEQELLNDIFGKTPALGDKLALKSLRNDFALSTRLSDNAQKLQKLVREQYAIREKDIQKSEWFKSKGWVILIIAIFSLNVLFFIIAIILFVLSYTLWPLTDKGLALKRYLLGFKDYIKVAEAERLKILQSPEGAIKLDNVDTNNPSQMINLYERSLPYAMLFGQEKEWNKQLGKYYESSSSSPDWYRGSSTTFNSVVFASAISNFSTAASYTSASSSSSGGSGGGGSSGGGGGGGGGGGW